MRLAEAAVRKNRSTHMRLTNNNPRVFLTQKNPKKHKNIYRTIKNKKYKKQKTKKTKHEKKQ